MEFLKDVLSEETYNKVAEELQGKDNVKLANLASGEYVSKDKYTTLEGKVTDLETQLTNKQKDYEGLLTKVGDNDTLKAEIEALKGKAEEDLNNTKSAYESKLKSAAIKSELVKAKVRDATDIIGQLDTDCIKYENDVLTGLTEQIDKLKENKPYLFDTEEKPKGKGGLDHNVTDDNADENAMRAVMGLPPLK